METKENNLHAAAIVGIISQYSDEEIKDAYIISQTETYVKKMKAPVREYSFVHDGKLFTSNDYVHWTSRPYEREVD